jgi:hypothetical protein
MDNSRTEYTSRDWFIVEWNFDWKVYYILGRHIVSWKPVDVSEERPLNLQRRRLSRARNPAWKLAICLLRLRRWGGMFLRNVGWLSAGYTALYPRRSYCHNHRGEDFGSYMLIISFCVRISWCVKDGLFLLQVKWRIPFKGMLGYSSCPTFSVETIGSLPLRPIWRRTGC